MPVDVPSPIRTDGSNEFARHSMAERVPSIIDTVIERNPDYSTSIHSNLESLKHVIATDEPMAMFDPPAPDHDDWGERFAAHEGETWLGTEWFFSEMFAYRHLLAACRYWTTRRDPFRPFKEEERTSEALRTVVGEALQREGDVHEQLSRRLLNCLWGNRMDLSMKTVFEQGTDAEDEHLLHNDIPAVVRHLSSASSGPVHIIMDNAGTEEAFDLALADALLTNEVTRRMVLHVKMAPVLVSDVIGEDIFQLLDVMARHGGCLAELTGRIRTYIYNGRLSIVPDFFWNTDGRLWELPPRLQKAFRGAQLVIAKGDVNYRRLTNDALWPAGIELAAAVDGFPAPLLALRTIKSDTLVGVEASTVARLDRKEAGWRTQGTYGVAQYME